MIPSTILAIATALSSLLAVSGAVVVQRQATFTFLTPQPTETTTSYQSTSLTSSTPPTTTGTGTSSSPPTTSGTVPVTTSSSSSSTTEALKTHTPPPSSSTTGVTVPPPPVTKTSTSPLPSGTSGGGANCNGVQQWQAAFAYSAGDQVIYSGQLYTAKQWTYNNAPPQHADQWTLGGICAQPVNNQANCNGVDAWQSTVAYTSGNKAIFNGHLWSAVQWTESNAPGDTSGTWKDLGACA